MAANFSPEDFLRSNDKKVRRSNALFYRELQNCEKSSVIQKLFIRQNPPPVEFPHIGSLAAICVQYITGMVKKIISPAGNVDVDRTGRIVILLSDNVDNFLPIFTDIRRYAPGKKKI